MEELLMIMAAMMPEATLIEQLTDSCDEYRIAPTEDNKAKIFVNCTVLMAKHGMKKEGVEGYMEMKEQFEKFAKLQKLTDIKVN